MRSLVLALALTASLSLPGAARAISLTLVPSAPSVALGDPLTVTLQASALAGAAVGAFDVDLGFDPARLAFLSASFGAALGDVSLGEQLTDVIAGAGTLNVAAVSLLDPVALAALQGDPVALVSITFQTLAAGTGAVSVDAALISDAFAAALAVDDRTGASVEVVPEPALALALALAAAAFLAARRARA
jgi:hypothetical protein